MSEKDAFAIIKILQEKYTEGVARKDKSMKDEVLRLIDIIRELGNI